MSCDYMPEEKSLVNPKIEPCPHCDGTDIFVKRSPGPNKKRYSVWCRKCKTHTVHRFESELIAIKAWNWRKKK